MKKNEKIRKNGLETLGLLMGQRLQPRDEDSIKPPNPRHLQIVDGHYLRGAKRYPPIQRKWAKERWPVALPRGRRRVRPSPSTAPSRWRIRLWTSHLSRNSCRSESRSVVKPETSATPSPLPVKSPRSPSPPTPTSRKGTIAVPYFTDSQVRFRY